MTTDERSASHAPAGAPGAALREAEWGRRLAALVLGWTAFETLSGLSLWLLPFSVPNEWMVIVHTGAGLLFLAPALVYQARHLAIYWSRPASAIVWMGWLALAAMLVALVSGGVLTWQALFGPRLGAAWDTAHLVSTVGIVAFLVPHVVVLLLRDRRVALSASPGLLRAQRVALLRAAAAAAGGFALVGFAWLLQPGERLANVFPADYSWRYGADRPFAPSLARTVTGGAYDARSLSGSASCGTAGCHSEIAAEWSVSAHRWAAMDPGFQRIQQEMAKQNGAESTRYCGGCHDPISLFSGAKTVFSEHLTASAGYDEGVACLVCHSVRSTDLQGNAHYVLAQPRRYLFEQRAGPAALRARDFLMRAYPWQHKADLSKRLFKTPEYCAACHKQFIDREVNNVGWVQLQNQYDNWRKSRWNHPGDPKRTIECRECHMPLVASTDPAAGDDVDYNRSADDGRHRSHRFIAANQFVPAVLKLKGADEQIQLTERWLRGDLPVPEIAGKWASGPAVALELAVPERARPGQPVAVRAVITSNKVGHDFPTGPLDIIQSWIDLTARDDQGRVVFHTGQVDDRHFIEPGTFMFKAEPVDQFGNLIDRHNLWEMVGVRYRRSLFPGFSDTAEFAFRCPGGDSDAAVPDEGEKSFAVPIPAGASGHLTIEARLLYRKIDQYLLNFMFGKDSGLTAPVTEMARATASIPLTNSVP